MSRQINRTIRRLTATEPAPAVRWQDVVRIDAVGTDAIGAFEVSVTFTYENGTQDTLFVHHTGYDDILDLLCQRFPSIPQTWYDEMAEQPWHVERLLYSRQEH